MIGATLTSPVQLALDKALSGERISDDDARTLLESRELVRIGRVAHELRCRRTPADQVTFIVDRNLNYTNICYTDCNFCAFYRRPGDTREGYTLPRPVIYKKIEETLALGGTALLMQGGHNPELGIDWYEDLFRSIKARYPIHLHALSPSEVQHIARKAKLTPSETLSRLRDAGLDSLPGGGAEILVDRVRTIISPIKTTSDEWLGIMRAAHRLGMSTTATMMWGHVETLDERVEHLRRIRELQDEMHGFRAFISWTFQPDNTELAQQVTWYPDQLRLPADAGGQPHLPRQRRPHPELVGHPGHQDRPGGAVLRRRRHGLDHDRGERGLGRGHDPPGGRRRLPAHDPQRGLPAVAARHAVPDRARLPARRRVVKASVSRRMPSAAPQDVWDVISDPHRHVRTLPTSVSQVEVLGSGEISCTVSAMGKTERMLVRRTELEPPRRLVEHRVDGTREGSTEFVVEPDGSGSRVTLTAVVELPRLLAVVAKGPIEHGLKRQLELLEQEASS